MDLNSGVASSSKWLHIERGLDFSLFIDDVTLDWYWKALRPNTFKVNSTVMGGDDSSVTPYTRSCALDPSIVHSSYPFCDFDQNANSRTCSPDCSINVFNRPLLGLVLWTDTAPYSSRLPIGRSAHWLRKRLSRPMRMVSRSRDLSNLLVSSTE